MFIWGAVMTALLLLRLVAIARVPLLSEEAYYWMYSQHPALSYFDHPPMVAWMIHIGTFLFGNTEFGVRILACLMMGGASVAMYFFARLLFGRRAALLAACALQILPVYFVTGALGMTDSPLIFFWMLTLWAFSEAVRRNKLAWWCAAGLACGGAMLSKYTAIFLPAGVLLVLFADPIFRRLLRMPGPYLAAIIALVCFMPVLIWNARHEWASFTFQSVDRFEHAQFGWRFIGRFLFYQMIVATPLLLLALPGLGQCIWRRRKHPRWTVAWAFSLPLLLVMAGECFHYEVHINWTLPAYLSMMPAAFYLLEIHIRSHSIGWRQWIPGMQVAFAVCVAINVLLFGYLLKTANSNSRVPDIGPWHQLAVFVEKYEDQFEDQTHQEPMVVAGGTYRLASLLGFYRYPLERAVPSSYYTTSGWFIEGKGGLEFAYWANRQAWRGRNCVFITDEDDLVRRLSPYFDSVREPDATITIAGETYHIALCQKFHPARDAHRS